MDKPQPLAVHFENIPASLKDKSIFVMWKYALNTKGDKWTKPPYQTNGIKASSTNHQTWASLDTVQAAYKSGNFDGIGLMLKGGIVGIDLDHVIHDSEIEPWAKDILEQFKDSYIEYSPGGDGFHILCNGTTALTGKSGPDNRLEIYDHTSPRYFTLTGHIYEHCNAELSNTQDELNWLASKYAKKEPSAALFEYVPQVKTSDSVQTVLDTIGRSNSSANFNQLNAGIGVADASANDLSLCNIVAYFTTDENIIDSIFRQSKLMRDKWDVKHYANGDTYGMGTINAALKGTNAQSGIAARAKYNTSAPVAASFDTVDALPLIEVIDAPTFDIERPNGLVGLLADYILNSSRMPIKSFAIAGALSAVSFLNNNQYFVKNSHTSLNLYQTLIGNTGGGKEDPRKAVKRIAIATDSQGGINEGLSSGTALLRSLSTQPNQLLLIDEIGIFLQVALSEKGSVHQKELVKDLLNLFGTARSTFAGKAYADTKLNIGKIEKPYVSILGTTTQVELLDGITSKSVTNGFLNRFLFIQASEALPVNRSPDLELPQNIIVEIQRLTGLFHGNETALSYDLDAFELMVQLSDAMKAQATGEYADLWSRAEEQMIRVAGLIALGDGGLIKCSHINWAHDYVKHCIAGLALSLGAELAENVFEKRIVKARNIILNARTFSDSQFKDFLANGYMPKGKLTKLMKLSPHDMHDVIGHLIDSKQVDEVEIGKTGKKTVLYRLFK